jgi:3'-phosphoadenosine 5'-phosphosulfate sulfotransferase (PAPS reductase)/FAD synthetase
MASPLGNARTLLQEVREQSDSILVGLSGGKDSLAVLDLCASIFPKVEAYYMYLVRDLRCVESGINYVARRYDVKVHKYPHWRLGQFMKYGVYMPHRATAAAWRDCRFIDIEAKAQEDSGIEWSALGHRMTDSLERRGMLNPLQGIDHKTRRVYPIWLWKTKAVFAYLRAKRIPLPPSLSAEQRNMTSANLRVDTLIYMREHYPDDYEKMKEVFPYAEAQIKRREFNKQWKIEALD